MCPQLTVACTWFKNIFLKEWAVSDPEHQKQKSVGFWLYCVIICWWGFASYIIVINTCTAASTPLLKDIYQYITPQYAADWKVIGTLLGLPTGELKRIEAGYPTNVKWCCNQMLEKWLEVDSSASWSKLLSVIQSPAVSSCSEKGDKLL